MEISVDNLQMCFSDGDRTIELFSGLTFNVPSGASLAIMGESGVGKTTLLYLLGGLEIPTAGDITVGGQSYRELRDSRQDLALFRGRTLGFVFQFHNLLPEFDAVENVALPLLIRGESSVASRRRAAELLERVGLGHRLAHRPGALSGGEQQRVAIARAMVGGPGVILADEPTGNLDHRTGGEVRRLMLELQRERGTTLVLVTHSSELAASMDRVVELTVTGMRERPDLHPTPDPSKRAAEAAGGSGETA